MEPRTHAISWNITQRCNLRCAHCYLDAAHRSGRRTEELSTEACLRVVDQIARVTPGTFLILTGGEPLLRPDLYEIAAHAAARGCFVVVGSNGLALTPKAVRRLQASGVQGVGISLDASEPKVHDAFRGVPGAWEQTVRAARVLRDEDMPFLIQTTVTQQNHRDLEAVAELACHLGAQALNVYFLVCTGRGQEMTDLSPQAYEATLERVYALSRRYGERMWVTAKCAPHFRRVVHRHDPNSPLMKTYQGGCPAGTHYARITPAGEVTPCPYIPTVAGSLKQQDFRAIWADSPLMHSLRQPALRERCGVCEYRSVCGGCRARALAAKGDLLADDPWCTHVPQPRAAPVSLPEEQTLGAKVRYGMPWTPEARQRLERVPGFARSMVVRSVEAFAREQGHTRVTPELMQEAKARLIGDGRGIPAFLRRKGMPSP